MARLLEVGAGPVNPTEQQVVTLLLSGLPASYWVLPNLSLAEDKGGHVYEYDVVVVAPHAVHVLEVKAWSGKLTAVTRLDWQLENGQLRRNPLPLTELKARVLSSVLRGLNLRDGQRPLPFPYVQAAFVAGSDQTQFEVFKDEQTRCLRPRELVAYLQDPARLARPQTPNLFVRHTETIARCIAGQLSARSPAPRRFGSYLQLETLSQDESSGVFLARHALLDDKRLYRVRTWRLSPYQFKPDERLKRVQQLRRAAEALSRIGDHPNLLTLREFGESDDLFYEVTDWSERGTLAHALAQGTAARWTLEKKLRILFGIARALEATAAADVYHRNLSPHAVLLAEKEQPRLFGFDRAFILAAANTVFADTRALEQLHYQAPELHSIELNDVFENTDLYSLGVLGLELLTGQRPPAGWLEGLGQAGDSPVPALDALLMPLAAPVQAGLRTFLTTLVQPDTSQRLGSPREAVSALKSLILALTKGTGTEKGTSTETGTGTESGVQATPEPSSEAQPRAEQALEPPTLPSPSPSPRDPSLPYEAGDLLAGAYRVEHLLGEGNTARVYAVTHLASQQQLALKLFHPRPGMETVEPFLTQLWLGGRTHPRLVPYLSTGDHREGEHRLPFAVMRRLEGQTLQTRLTQAPPTRAEALAWAEQLLEVLAVLHAPDPAAGSAPLEGLAGVLVHRDLRPANLFVTPQGILLMDLETLRPVQPGILLAPVYLRAAPPDLAQVGYQPDADIFAVALMLVEWLTGAPPWSAALPPAQPLPEDWQADGPDDTGSLLPPPLRAALRRALAPTQAARREAGAALLQAVRDARLAPPAVQTPALMSESTPAPEVVSGLEPAPEQTEAPAPVLKPSPSMPSPAGPSPSMPSPAGPLQGRPEARSALLQTPDLLERARKQPPAWTASLLEALIHQERPALRLYRTLRTRAFSEPLPPPSESDPSPGGLEHAFVQAELQALRLERPLATCMPSLYDQLLQPQPPLPAPLVSLEPEDSATEAPLEWLPEEPLLKLELLHLAELPGLLLELEQAGWSVEEHVWSPELLSPELLSPELLSPELLSPGLPEGPVLRLPVGRLADGSLLELLQHRRALLHAQVQSFLRALTPETSARSAPPRVHLVVTRGVLYLGHGLGIPLPGEGRPTWSQSFGPQRHSLSPLLEPLPASSRRFLRTDRGQSFLLGRWTWPRPLEAPRLEHGGLSLLERLLPWLVLRPIASPARPLTNYPLAHNPLTSHTGA